jgi:hypothetical protein
MSTKLRLSALFGFVIICTSWIVGCGGDDKPATPPTTPAPAPGGTPPADTPKAP